jgi:hypothetical protein
MGESPFAYWAEESGRAWASIAGVFLRAAFATFRRKIETFDQRQ